MRKQISSILGAFIFLFACTAVMAQDKEMHAEKKMKMEQRMEAMMNDLDLDDNQRAQFMEMNEKYASEMKAVKESDADKETKKSQLMAIKEQRDSDMKALLNDEQYEKYKMHQKKNKEKMKKKASEY